MTLVLSVALPAPAVRRAVEQLLSARYGGRVDVVGVERFPYSSVWRCALAGAGVPPSVVVRLPRDAREDPARAGAARLVEERAALEFLSSIGSGGSSSGSTLVPRFIAGAAGISITEDLGPHPSLLDLLLGSGAAAAEGGVLAFARGLGALHARTAGRSTAYEGYRARLGAVEGAEVARVDVLECWRLVREAAAQLGLPGPGGGGESGVDGDVEEVARMLATPGGYLALSNGDPSPVNCKIVPGGVRFFDFEAAGFRHALIDAGVLRYFYPTGGPPWRLPPDVAERLEPAYRRAIAPACPAALDDAPYERGMAVAGAAWTITRLARLPRVAAGPDRDSWRLLPPGWSAPIPTRSRRRQLVSIVETCSASLRRAGTLTALAAWCERLLRALRARWPEATEALPLYPAFA